MRSNELISSDEPIVERIAEEILERQRAGERPTVEEYCQQYPEHAEELRTFLPALIVVEGLKPNSKDASGTFGGEFEIEGKRREFIGDYRILRELGRGGMGVVYEAEQQSLGRHVALKVLLRSVAGDARAAKRFESEAKAAARMHHTNIVPVFDVGSDDQHLFYAMQLIQGQAIDLVIDDLKQLRNLRGSSVSANAASKPREKSIARSLVAGQFHQDQLLELQRDSSQDAPDLQPIQNASPLAPPAGKGTGGEGSIDVTETLDAKSISSQSAVLPGHRDMSSAENNRPAYYLSVAKIGHQTAEALAYAHARGIIHRDIKPSNLLLDGNGIVWITDFGLAKTGDHGMTHTGDILGTIRYMSPERFKGQCDVRADIYSLGLTLYELLALQPAFAASDQLKLIDRIVKSEPPAPRTLEASVPRDLETIVLKCIDKDPRRRYQSADELCEDLERFIHDEPVKARRISLTERIARWSRRNKAMAASLAVAATLLLIINIAGPLMTWRMATLKSNAEKAEKQAVHAQSLADQRADDAVQARQIADERADTINRNLYLSNMNLASAAARIPGGMQRLVKLTDEWLPQPGQPDLRGWEWYYLNSLARQGSTTFDGHSDSIREVAWSPDGTRAASVSREAIKIWNPQNGQTLQSLPSRTNGRISWSPDGMRLVSGGLEISIWNVNTGQLERSMPGSDDGWGGEVVWAPNGASIASIDRNKVTVWDASTGERQGTIEVSFRGIELAWSPDGSRLAVGGTSGEVGEFKGQLAICDAASFEVEGTLPLPGRYVTGLEWNPDSTRICVTNAGRKVTIWDIATKQILKELPLPDSALSVAWSPDGARIAAGLNNRMISIWNAETDAEITEPLLWLETRSGRRVTSLAWSADSTRIASASGSNLVQIWDVEQNLANSMTTGLESPIGYVKSILWNPEGDLLAMSAGMGSLMLWNTGTNELQAFNFEGSDRAHEVLMSPNGKRIAAKTVDGIGIWDTETDHYQIWDIARPYVMSWCPESTRLAAVCFQDNGLVRILNADNGEQKSLEGHRNHSHSLAWSPDGTLLASGGGPGEGDVRIWNARTGLCELVLSGNRSMVKALAWSPDGKKRLAAGSEDNSIHLWDPYTASNPRKLSGHISQVQSIAWSPDGERLASTGRGNRLIVWDPETGLEAFSMECPVNALDGGTVRWSPDGRSLAVISDGTLKILDANPGYAAEEERLRRSDFVSTSQPE